MKKPKPKPAFYTKYRDSKTGKYVSRTYALLNPDTTQSIKVKPRGADCNHP